MQWLPPALNALAAWVQFVCWVAVPHPVKAGKFNKFPVDYRTGNVVDAHDPRYWVDASTAIAAAPQWDRGYGAGIGFVFTEADPFFFLDIDGAYDAATEAWSTLAQELIGRLSGAAVEVSMSGTGLHVIGRSAPLAHGCKNQRLGLELYTSRRFVALTGLHAYGDAAADVGPGLWALAAEYFPLTAGGTWDEWSTEPVGEYTGPADDDELVRRALASSQRNAAAAFGASGPTFADLWEGRADVLAKRWPGEAGKPYGQSEADQALANMLAFWTGKNCERMERLMRRSALVRDKWENHRTYLGDTITKACAFVEKVYTKTDAPPEPVITPPSTEVMLAAASERNRKLRDVAREYMGPAEQLEHFDGCYFDNTTGRIYSLPRNTEFDKSKFDVNYGGHMFILDPSCQKTTDSAWEAYTRSRVNHPVIVDGLCFRPERPPGELVREGNREYVNSYVPYEVRTVDGDAAPFLAHVAKLLPDENDRKILLHYLASMAQNPGRKFQWWPVLQGAEGNGKTILITAMTYVLGQEYTHLPNSHKMAKSGSNFNGWIYRKLFIGVEEIMLSHKRDFLDEFKVVVTNERLEIESKGKDQFTGDNRVNGILCTNHKDGVPVTVDTRRYAIFYTAQQVAEDLTRDGMTPEYFSDLWDWLKGRGAYAAQGESFGLACVAQFLKSYPLEAAYDPAQLSTRAPKTTSTAEAIVASLGRAEQEIMDAVEEGRPGFAGGWVSSKYLDLLLDQIRANVPRNKRREMMRQLGYDMHPALPGGRVNDVVMPDNGKPRLYLRRGHLALNADLPADIARMYSKAQEPGGQNAAPIQSPAALAFAPKQADPSKAA